MVKLRESKTMQGNITYEMSLPVEIVRTLHWRKGDMLQLTIKDNKTIILNNVTEGLRDKYLG